jgi:anti-anti-sigma factor
MMTMTNLNESGGQVFPVKANAKLSELVLGHERDLVARVAPLVRGQSIALDLAQIERVDAAGIAALVELYALACEAGNDFCILNAAPHVTEVLRVCGLDRILISHNAVHDSYSGRRIERTAA